MCAETNAVLPPAEEPPYGVEVRDTKLGIRVFRIHYTADPDKRSAEWKAEARRGMSARDWAREYEIDWTVASGLPIFAQDFDRNLHVAKGRLHAIENVPLVRMWDFGLTPACIIGQVTPLGGFNVLDEFVTWDGRGEIKAQGIDRMGEHVLLVSKRRWPEFEWEDYCDPAGFQRAQTDARSAIQVMWETWQRHGETLSIQPGPVAFEARRKALASLLTRVERGRAIFQVDSGCRMIIEGLAGAYRYEQVGEGLKLSYKPKPEKNAHSHPMEALCYGVGSLFFYRDNEKPDHPSEDEEEGTDYYMPNRASSLY